MSSEQVRERTKGALKTMKELLEKAEESTHKALDRAAPAAQRSIDASLEAASRGFTTTMKTIDGATSDDQLKLLKMYRRFLGGQADYIDGKIRTLEEKVQAGRQPAPGSQPARRDERTQP